MPVPDGIQCAAGLPLDEALVAAGRRTAAFEVAADGCLVAGAAACTVPIGRPSAWWCRGASSGVDAAVTAAAPCGVPPAATSAVAPTAPIATTAPICRMAAGTTVCGSRACLNRPG